jgi:hypothetical protein
MTVTPTLSPRPDHVVLRWIDRLQLWWGTEDESDARVLVGVGELDDRILRDIGLEHLTARARG